MVNIFVYNIFIVTPLIVAKAFFQGIQTKAQTADENGLTSTASHE